jgi:cation transporter-like permease
MGMDTLISPGEVLVGPVPAVPVLAGLPSGPLTGVGPALLGIPLAAGICAGLLLNRRRRTEWGNLLGAAVLAGPVAGALLQFFGFAASGAIGSGRLVGVGVVTWWVGLLAAIVVSVGCVVAALTIRAVTYNP